MHGAANACFFISSGLAMVSVLSSLANVIGIGDEEFLYEMGVVYLLMSCAALTMACLFEVLA